MAALALTFVACSNDDNDMAQQEGKIPFSATIAAPNSGATTRTTYTESGTSINVVWKSGDQIALVHGGVKDVVTVSTPNPDGSAPITGTITVGSDNEDIVLVYPADLVAVLQTNSRSRPVHSPISRTTSTSVRAKANSPSAEQVLRSRQTYRWPAR